MQDLLAHADVYFQEEVSVGGEDGTNSDSEQTLVSSLNLILLFISIVFVFKATFY